jgi:hypothetical protein
MLKQGEFTMNKIVIAATVLAAVCSLAACGKNTSTPSTVAADNAVAVADNTVAAADNTIEHIRPKD